MLLRVTGWGRYRSGPLDDAGAHCSCDGKVHGQGTRLSVMERWKSAWSCSADSSLERWRVTFLQRCAIWDGRERESVYSPCVGAAWRYRVVLPAMLIWQGRLSSDGRDGLFVQHCRSSSDDLPCRRCTFGAEVSCLQRWTGRLEKD